MIMVEFSYDVFKAESALGGNVCDEQHEKASYTFN